MSSQTVDLKSFLVTVKEFVKALKEKHTYNIRENWYCLFGIVWGTPIPIVTLGIDIYSSGLSLNMTTILSTIISHPIHFFFLLHPVIFGIVFGAMGTVRHTKEMEIEKFEASLINKNEQLKKINKRLKELDELKSNFLSMVSHELRTPLTTILGYISFLKSKKKGALEKAQMESLDITEKEAVRLDHLIEELLDLSRIEAGELKVNLRRVDMSQIADKAVNSLQPLAKSRGVILVNNLPNKLAFVLADRERIFQVASNLIENAIKFNKSGGKVYISSVNGSVDSRVKLCISDTGVGIEQDKLDKIFDKFYRVDSSGKSRHRGCGLGLAISKSIVELHKGKIWAESEVGVGSKFFIELIRYDK